MQPTTPPGWYADPQQPHSYRWFDGTQWTQHVAPAGAPPPDNGPDTVQHWLLPVGRSWQSILAGYLGLFSIVLILPAPFAIGFGMWGLRVASDGGHGRGR